MMDFSVDGNHQFFNHVINYKMVQSLNRYITKRIDFFKHDKYVYKNNGYGKIDGTEYSVVRLGNTRSTDSFTELITHSIYIILPLHGLYTLVYNADTDLLVMECEKIETINIEKSLELADHIDMKDMIIKIKPFNEPNTFAYLIGPHNQNVIPLYHNSIIDLNKILNQVKRTWMKHESTDLIMREIIMLRFEYYNDTKYISVLNDDHCIFLDTSHDIFQLDFISMSNVPFDTFIPKHKGVLVPLGMIIKLINYNITSFVVSIPSKKLQLPMV